MGAGLIGRGETCATSRLTPLWVASFFTLSDFFMRWTSPDWQLLDGDVHLLHRQRVREAAFVDAFKHLLRLLKRAPELPMLGPHDRLVALELAVGPEALNEPLP